MKTFLDWIKTTNEAAVPDVVDLTNGGKKKDGTTYWGAVPKTGSTTKGQAGQKKDEVKDALTGKDVQDLLDPKTGSTTKDQVKKVGYLVTPSAMRTPDPTKI